MSGPLLMCWSPCMWTCLELCPSIYVPVESAQEVSSVERVGLSTLNHRDVATSTPRGCLLLMGDSETRDCLMKQLHEWSFFLSQRRPIKVVLISRRDASWMIFPVSSQANSTPVFFLYFDLMQHTFLKTIVCKKILHIETILVYLNACTDHLDYKSVYCH